MSATDWLPSTWQTNFKDTAHYVPLTGEIRASKIQGEGRGYPDSEPGDPDYVGNPTGIAKPEEMRMDDRRYRRMCWPDGRYINTVYNYQIFSNTGSNRYSIVPAGYMYPQVTSDSFYVYTGSFYNSYTITYDYNPFRNVTHLYPYNSQGQGTGSSTLNWYAYNAFEMDFHEKPPITEMQYRKERATSIANNQNQYVNQIKYCRGLDRTDSDWYAGGFGYSDRYTGTPSYPLSAVNENGDGPFNTPISKAGEIKFSDFRGKNKMYKTRSAIGHHSVEGDPSGAVNYAKTGLPWNSQVLGNSVYSSPIYEYASLYMAGTYGRATTLVGSLANGNALYAVGYVNPDFGGKVSASGITLPNASGALENTSIPAKNYFTANAANSSSRYKPYWARNSISEPKNSARIGRYDSVTKSMPTYDYVNQGTTGGSTHSHPNTVNRPPIVSNPRDGEMTHLIWYADPSYNSNGDLNRTPASSWNSANFPASETSPRIGERVVEFGILGRHYNTNRLIQGLYWDTGGRYGVQNNDGAGGFSSGGKGQFVDNTNAFARTAGSGVYSEIFYASPSAENLFFGQTVWRMSYLVYSPHYDGTSLYSNPSAVSYPTTHSSGLVYGGITGNYYSTRIVWAPGGTYDRYDFLKHFPEFDGVNA